MDDFSRQCEKNLPPLAEFQKTGVWAALCKAASDVLNVFEKTAPRSID
jgi:hypothetical protein